jgi:hypothetical protein
MLGRSFLIPYADVGGKTEELGGQIIHSGKRVHTFQSKKSRLVQLGANTIKPTLEEIGAKLSP